MAYNKTVWANDTAPAINADNLNKIEQGIFDAQNIQYAFDNVKATDLFTTPFVQGYIDPNSGNRSNTSGSGVTFNYFIPYYLRQITATKDFYVGLYAYDKYGVYQGMATGEGVALQKSTTIYNLNQIPLDDFFAAYPTYRFKFCVWHNPWGAVTPETATANVNLVYIGGDKNLRFNKINADAGAVNDFLYKNTVTKKVINSSELEQGAASSSTIYVNVNTALVTKELIRVCDGTKVHFKPGTTITRIRYYLFDLDTFAYKSATAIYGDERTFTITGNALLLPVFQKSTDVEVTASEYDATFEILSPLYSEKVETSEYTSETGTLHKYMTAIFPCNANDYYYITEGRTLSTPQSYVWLRFHPYLLLRGVGHDVSLTWTSVTSLPNAVVETSPDGVASSLKLSSGTALLFDITTYEFSIVTTPAFYNSMPNKIVMAQIWNGSLIRGVLLDGYIHQNIRETNQKLKDMQNVLTYTVDDTHNADIISINDEITYAYADTIKIGWITDIHSNMNGTSFHQKPIDFCTELTKYGQIKAYMVTGDLNYYQSEQTLQATKERMSEVARHLMEMKDFAQPLPCRGNHDGVSGALTYTYEMFTNAVIKPFISNYGTHGQYYYDVENKIRIIMLNSCMDSQARKGFSQEQLTWLETVLDNTPEGYGVMVDAHHPINAAQAGSTPSDNLPTYYEELVSILQNFKTNRTDCDLIGYFFGHVHKDNLAVLDGFIQCSLIDSSGDKSQFSSDILCIDTVNKIVNLIRLGQGENRAFGYGPNNTEVITG